MPVARVGIPRSGSIVIQVLLVDLHPLHPVPRPGTPPNSIQNLVSRIRANGYDLAQPIPVARMPDGRLVQMRGHHRAEAMRRLGEATIPARLVDWNSIDVGVRNMYRRLFPIFPWDDFIR